MIDQGQLAALHERAVQILQRETRVAPGARSVATLGPSRFVDNPDAVFYRMGVADRADSAHVGVASLRLDFPGATTRTFLFAVYGSQGKIVVAMRWVPDEDRPTIVRGAASASAWSTAELEDLLAHRIVQGRSNFEDQISKGEGGVESSSDLLSFG